MGKIIGAICGAAVFALLVIAATVLIAWRMRRRRQLQSTSQASSEQEMGKGSCEIGSGTLTFELDEHGHRVLLGKGSYGRVSPFVQPQLLLGRILNLQLPNSNSAFADLEVRLSVRRK